MASGRTAWTSSGVISGSGLAIAKMIGRAAMVFTWSWVRVPLADRPMNTSAPLMASVRSRASVSTAWALFHWLISSGRPRQSTPLRSTAMTLSWRTPIALISSMVAIPAAPGPFSTTRISARLRPVISQALIRPAAVMIAVPCWSSWNTGMSNSSCSSVSMRKQSGLLISSRLMPPNVTPMFLTTVITSSGSVQLISMSMASTSAKRLNNTPLPSITGLEASGPRLPSPRIAVPLEITATRLPLEVYS